MWKLDQFYFQDSIIFDMMITEIYNYDFVFPGNCLYLWV